MENLSKSDFFSFSPFIGKGDQPSQGASFNFPSHGGPPTVDDMVHAQGNDDKYHKTRAICEDLLKTFHLDWNDVQGKKINPPIPHFSIHPATVLI